MGRKKDATSNLANLLLSILLLSLIACGGGGGNNIKTGLRPSDTTPDIFKFTDQSNVALGATMESNSITVSGIDEPSPISITGGEYSIEGGSYTNATGTVNKNQKVKVRHQASSSHNTTTDTTLTIGGVSDTYSTTTIAATGPGGTTPEPFSFIDQMNVTLGDIRESNSITVSGINTPSPITITGGEYSIDDGGYTSEAGTIKNKQQVKVRHQASDSASTATNTTLTIGGISDTFTTTTKSMLSPKDSTPDAFTFEDATPRVGLGWTLQSNKVKISGINVASPVTITGGEYQINNGRYTDKPGVIKDQQWIRVRQTSSANYGTMKDTIVTIGGVKDSFSSTTVDKNTKPDAFTLVDQHNVALTQDIESNAIIVSGITAESDISVSQGMYSIDGAAYTNLDGKVKNGQSVRVRHTSAGNLNSLTESTLSIGGVEEKFRTTTTNTAIVPTALNLGFSLKTLVFTWSDTAGSTHYKLFEDPDGRSGYTQLGGNISTSAQVYRHGITVHARNKARYILETCDANGCVSSKAVELGSLLWSAVGYFKASNTGVNDEFGTTVALSGDGKTLAIGAPGERSEATGINGDETSDKKVSSGAVYIFSGFKDVNGEAIWRQDAYIKASNTDTDDSFGSSISLSADGNLLTVGAPKEDSAAKGINGDQSSEDAKESGAVYVYSRHQDSSGITTWRQEAYIKASNTGAFDRFGHALSLSGDSTTLAVGAHWEDSEAEGINNNEASNDALNSGATYVFNRQLDGSGNATWTQEAYIKASNTQIIANFGTALSLSKDGNTLVVGAPEESGNDTGINGDQTTGERFGAGAAYVFYRTRDASGIANWSQQAYVKASNTGKADLFGGAVSLSNDGNLLAVGAKGEDSLSAVINGDQTSNIHKESGAVYVFNRTFDATGVANWSQQAYIKASDSAPLDKFGNALSLSGDASILVVGTVAKKLASPGDIGAAYVFKREGLTWQQQYQTPSSSLKNFSNISTSVSDDGKTVVLGARADSSSATGVGGNPDTGDKKGASGAAHLL